MSEPIMEPSTKPAMQSATETAVLSVPQRMLLAFLEFYRLWLSPALHSITPAGGCGYEPTCSNYATEAIVLYGPILGSWMALRRILRCHPFARGGFDPVPLPGHVPHTECKHRAPAGQAPACALREPIP